MLANRRKNSAEGLNLFVTVLVNIIIIELAYTTNEKWYLALLIAFPAFMISAFYHKKHEGIHNKSK